MLKAANTEIQQFLTVEDHPISLSQALQYLQLSGKLQPFIVEILRQYIIDRELFSRDDFDISPALIEQAVIDFRLQNQLTDPRHFQEWLASNGIDYATFHKQVSSGFKRTKLKEQITQPKIQEYFIERKIFLDRVVLSRIIVDNQELAEELSSQIEEGVAFEDLAREYSIADDRIVNGMMGPVIRGTMPDVLRSAVDSVGERKIVGPLEIEGRWVLFRVEQFLPASLEDLQVKQALENELFEQWLAQKIQNLTVKLQVS
jgi:parvulin-like peptidyl-prolyl isomerase